MAQGLSTDSQRNGREDRIPRPLEDGADRASPQRRTKNAENVQGTCRLSGRRFVREPVFLHAMETPRAERCYEGVENSARWRMDTALVKERCANSSLT